MTSRADGDHGGTHHAEFKLSITKALADQLAETLEPLVPTALTTEALARVHAKKGVYELFLGGCRVYVGKSSKSLPDRLEQHRKKLSGRSGIDIDDLGFVCAYVDEDLDAAAPEKMLIKKYGSAGAPWNNNGFGNKDPGRKRDHSEIKQGHFDAKYPINLDLEIVLEPRAWTVDKLLNELKRILPYNLRFQVKAAVVYKAATVAVPPGPIRVREIIELLIASLPEGWQATALPGYVILYEEKDDVVYDAALAWWRRGANGGVAITPGPARFVPGEVTDDDLGDEDEDE